MKCNTLDLTQLLLCNLVFFMFFSFVGTVMLRHHPSSKRYHEPVGCAKKRLVDNGFCQSPA